MSFVFGIVLSLLTAGTATWAVAGHRLAALPGVARVLDYVDGGYNLPSERAVDELVAIAESRRAHGLHDRDEVMPNGQTFAEYVESSRVPNLISEAAIEAAPRYKAGLLEEDVLDGHERPGDRHGVVLPVPPAGGWRGWLRGGYNMPTEAEITAAPPKTLRGAYRYPVPDGWVFADENDAAVELLRSRRMLGTIGGVPFPSHEQHAADLARNGWGAP